ncbi:uncharacterized protein LOC116219539 [Clupea harengus]|uniref:Uncharacterized protein LOC116219539 n=1 Tax=Clupea harengus TaxID=7950 RepID=A0A8M1K7D1_CLUHA|nr:uncharacterized protein LOC116219539 [Clupea harengus]
MPQTVISVSESVSPLYTVEREETAAQEQSVEEALIAAAAGVSVLPAECSGTDRDESTETADVVTTENTPHKSFEESVVSVTPVRSPIQMNMNEIADADDLNLVKEMPESLADNSELSPLAQVHPEEMLGFPSDQTSAAGGECPNTTDIGFITSGGIPCQEESLTETVKTTEMGTTSKVSSETSEISQTVTSVFEKVSPLCTVDGGGIAAQEPSVEEILNAAAAVLVAAAAAAAVESVMPPECSGSDNAECLETVQNVLKEDMGSVLSKHSGVNLDAKSASEPVDNMTPIKSPIQENMSETADADDLVEGMPESLADYSEPSPFRQEQPEETADSSDEHIVLTSPADEDGPKVTYTECITCDGEEAETALQEPSGEDALGAVESLLVTVAEVPQTDTLEVDWTLDTGLNREEAKAQQPSGDGALSVSPVVNKETESPVVNEETDSPEKGSFVLNRPFESSETETFEKLGIAEIVVPQDMGLVSVGCSRDITEGSLCQSAGDSIDHRESSPTGPSLKATNEIIETDYLSLVTEASDHVSDILEPSPLRKGLSEERMTSELSVDTPAQVFTASEEYPGEVVTICTGHIPSARIPTQEEDVSISRGTTDRGASPIFSPNTSSVSGCVHVSTQVSDMSVVVTASDTQGNQSPASSNHLPGPPCSAEEQQQHTPDSVAERGTLTPFNSPVLKGSVNQMWTLYDLHHSSDEGTFCTNILSQPPFNGSAYIHAFGPGHVLLAERSPQHSRLDLHQASEGLVEGTTQASDLHRHRAQDVAPTTEAACSVHPSASLRDTGTQEIILPNYLLCVDDKQATPLMGAPGGPAQSVRVRRDDASGLLSLTFPSAVLGGAQRRGGQSQFMQISTDQGHSVYSPAVLRIVTNPADQN